MKKILLLILLSTATLILPAADFELKTGHMAFRINKDASGACFVLDSDEEGAVQGSDFWRLILDREPLIEIPVLSRNQKGKVTKGKNSLTISYDRIVSEYGQTYPIRFSVTVSIEDGLLRFSPVISNGTDDVRVNECFCPVLHFNRISGEKAEDSLLWPNGMGSRYVNPYKMMEDKVAVSSTTATRNDKEISMHLLYPRASMSWFGVQSGEQFLYIARPDDRFRFCQLDVRHTIHSSDLLLAIEHMPMERPGETLEIPYSVVGFLDGDWRKGADRYRSWADKHFYKVEERPEWIQNMSGFQRITLRSQSGSDRYTYEQLPQLYEDAASCGLNAIFLFAWWKEGMDRGYPEYTEPYPGAYKELAKNIKKVQDMGGHVILVCNAHFADRTTDWYKSHSNLAMHNVWGQDYNKFFSYSGAGNFHVDYAPRPISVMCFCTEEWRAQVLSQLKFMGDELGVDCVFADCIGGCPMQPCFNDTHEHGPRVDEDWTGKLKFFRAGMDYAQSKGLAFGTEVLTDIAAMSTHFIHSLENAEFRISDSSYPALFRYTFPEAIATNRKIQNPEYKGFEKQFKYALTQGVRIDAALYGCRKSITTSPEYADIVKFCADKLQEYGDFFLQGTYTVTDTAPLPSNIKRGEYYNQDKTRLLTVTYDTKTDDMTFEVTELCNLH